MKKNAGVIFLVTFVSITLASGNIIVENTDTVWNLSIIPATEDVINSSDAQPQNITTIFVKDVDTKWNSGMIPASEEMINSNDAQPQNISTIYVKDVDTKWNSGMIPASEEMINSSDAQPQNISTIYVKDVDTTWKRELIYPKGQQEPLRVIKMYSPADGSYAGSNVTFSFMVQDTKNSTFTCTLDLNNHRMGNISTTSGNITETNMSIPDSGIYTWNVTCVNSDQEIISSPTWMFMRDDVAPLISLLSPAQDELFNTSIVQFRILATDNLGFPMKGELWIDGEMNVSNITIENNTIRQLSLSLPDGFHNWNISVEDGAGNKNSTEIRRLDIDTIAPIIISSPEDNANSTLPFILFNFTAFDDRNTSLVYDFYLNGKIVNSSSIWYATPATLTSPVNSGSYSWYIDIFDKAGNRNTSNTRTFNSLTDLLISNLSFSIDNPHQDSIITIYVTVKNSGIEANNVNVSVRDENNGLIGTKKISLNASNNFSFALPWNLAGLGSGNHTAKVEIAQYPYLDSNLSNNIASANISIAKDVWPPFFSGISFNPVNITEHSTSVKFTVIINDTNTGINNSSAKLNFVLNGTLNATPLTFLGQDRYETILTADWDANQGSNITFYASASDNGGNYNESTHQEEYIDKINDMPILTIISPQNYTIWGGTRTIEWVCDNDNEGPCLSSVYYWKSHPWAPAYPDPRYWNQGIWVKLVDAGANTSYLWNTSDLNLKTKINITATDGTFNVSKVSGEFTIDNNNVTLTIENYYHPPLNAFVANESGFIRGKVNGIDSRIINISINKTDYSLIDSPIGKIESNYSFSSNTPITEPFAVSIDAVDEAGNTGTITGLFIIDNSAPVFESLSIDPAFTNASVTLHVAVADNYKVNALTATVPTASGIKEMPLNLNSSIFEGKFTVPDKAGNYSISILAVDIAGNINSTYYNFTVFSGPELSIVSEDIIFDPEFIVTGGTVNITASIHNKGDRNASGVNISFFRNSSFINGLLLDLPANSSTPASILWNTTGVAGNATISVKIGKSNSFSEVNYSDNTANKIYFVDAPDLIVENISFQPEAPVYSGAVVNIFAKITNLRNIDANNVRINFYVGSPDKDHLIGYSIVNVHNSTIASTQWNTAGYLSDQTVYVRINPDNTVPELNTLNNMASRNFFLDRYIGEQIPETLTFQKNPLTNITNSKVRGMTSGDFNNDSIIDFAAGTETGEVIVYENKGIGLSNNNRSRYVNFTPRIVFTLSGKAYGLTSGDFYNDGFSDIVAGTANGEVILLNNTLGKFSKVVLFDAGDEAYGLSTADYDEDGDLDLVVGDRTGHVSIYLNDNMSFTFSRIIATREQPYGMTSGDYDLNGKIDVIVGDRLGQLTRIMNENGTYRSYPFADIGSFAHGLTTADFDFNGKLDIAAIGFDGVVNLFYSRGEGLVMSPLKIARSENSYGITSGDYDRDNDIDMVIGTDSGEVYLLLNSLHIEKYTSRNPMPASRPVEVTTVIENPWVRKIEKLNTSEEWGNSLEFMENSYMPIAEPGDSPKYFPADIHFYDGPINGRYKYEYYLKLPDKGCIRTYDTIEGTWSYCDRLFILNGVASKNSNSLSLGNISDIFKIEGLYQRESIKYSYFLRSNEPGNNSIITNSSYIIAGKFVTYPTNYLLSDDVSNVNDASANIKNLNPSEYHNDRGFYDEEIRAPDFSIADIYQQPGTQTVNVRVSNLNNISIEKVELFIEVDGVIFKDDIFDIDAFSSKWFSYNFASRPAANITASVNRNLAVLETNYSNNNRTILYQPLPPVDYQYIDLVPVKIAFNNTPTEGQYFNVSVTVENRGSNTSSSEILYFVPANINQNWINKTVECDTNSSFYDENICSGFYSDYPPYPKIKYDIPIPPGENYTFNATFRAVNEHLSSQGTWNYNALVYTGSLNQIDANNSNNAISTLLNVLPSDVDLTMYYGYWGEYRSCNYDDRGGEKCYYPISLTNPISDTISINIREFNPGGTDAGNHSMLVYLDNNTDNAIYRIDDLGLAKHSFNDNSFEKNWSSIPPGDHILYFLFDHSNYIGESNEKNNVFTQQFKWKDPSAGSITYSIQNPTDGDIVYVNANIENKGDIRTGNFNAALYVNDKFIANQTVSLLAHEIKQISFSWKATASRNQQVKVVLDPENIIPNEDESNNIAYSKINAAGEGWEMELLSEGFEQEQLSTFSNKTGIWNDIGYFSNIPVGRNAVPRFADLDADNDLDLVLGVLDGNIKGYKNTGSSSSPAWIEYNWNLPEINTGLRSAPTFSDLDSDGDKDLIIANYTGYFIIYENTGTPASPTWKRNDSFQGLDSIRFDIAAKPYFTDIDGDGDSDLFIGTKEGKLLGYENTRNTSHTEFKPALWDLSAVNVPAYASPAFGDIDQDGDYDLIVGSGSGLVYVFENTGNSTSPVFEREELLSMSFNSSASPVLADLDADGHLDLIVGSNKENLIGLMQGYSYPIKLKIVNYANYDLNIYKDKIQFLNQTGLKKVTDVYLDNGFSVPPLSTRTMEYEITVPRDIPPGTLLGATSEKKYTLSQSWTNRPELGGFTTDLYPQNNTVYLIGAPYRIYSNGIMRDGLDSPGPLVNFKQGDTIVANSETTITAFEKNRKISFKVVSPDKPAVDIFLDQLGDFYSLRPGYIEDVEFIIENNNIIPYNVDRVILELEKDNKTYDLYTDTAGFTLPARNSTSKTYKVYVPEGVPLDAIFHIKVMEKFNLSDTIWHRSTANIWDNDTIFADEYYWDSQNFTTPNKGYRDWKYSWENERTYLRKHIWLESSLQKAEFKKKVEQICNELGESDPPSGIITYINREYYTSIGTSCEEDITSVEYGWTPAYSNLHSGDNEFTLLSSGPYRTWDATFYDLIAWNRVYGATVEAQPAFQIELSSLGQNSSGYLRRQYEEPVNVTVYNNDDDPMTVEVMQFDLITPDNRIIRLLTDLTTRTYAGNSNQIHTYTLNVPGDVPVGSKLRVTAEKTFSLPDKLWLRDHEATTEKLLSADTKDYGWGDTLPTPEDSKYRKQVFAPSNVTRMEAILGAVSELYLNGLYQGREYTGWSPVAVNSGLRKGENNLISVIGSIPDTESRIYSGQSFVKGEVVQPEEDSFYTVFGMREGIYRNERESFHVYPGEDIKARIKIDNFHTSTREFTLQLYIVDFEKNSETTLDTRIITIPGENSKYLEMAAHVPESISNDARLQLYSKYNEVVTDKAWLRASNVNDNSASNNFMDDSSWGVVGLSPENEKAKYFRKHLWVDSLTEDVQFSLSGVEKLWVNGLEVPISGWGGGYYSLSRNEITKSDENLIALKARSYDVDANIKLTHFVPIKTTDLDIIDLSTSTLMPLDPACVNLTSCNFYVNQSDPVKLNFALRNTGELHAREFNLTVYARHNKTGKITTLLQEKLTMKPYSSRDMNLTWNTSGFAGMYDLVVFADEEDVIIESSELNNFQALHIYVNAPPVINELKFTDKQGFGEPVDIEANVTYEVGNLKKMQIEITTPKNDIQSFNMSNNFGNIFTHEYINYTGGKYNLTVKAEDKLGLYSEISGSFELYDTLKIQLKTERDRYYLGEYVKVANSSLIRNLETTNTSIDIVMGIENFNGSWNLENSSLRRISLGGNSQVLLNTFWQPWDSRKGKAYNGTYRVFVEAVDPENKTIINRDGTLAIGYYNFTITNINTPPGLSGIPDKYVLENHVPKKKWINLLSYTNDNAQDPNTLIYEIINQTNGSLINCSIDEKYYITCSKPAENLTGSSRINVSVFDGLLTSFYEFEVNVVPTLQYDTPKITYSYSPPLNESGEWQTNQNDTGEYIVTVTASDGIYSDSQKVNITIFNKSFIISFVKPTPANNTTLNVSSMIINVTSNKNMSTALLEWNGVNESMGGSGKNWSIEKTNLSDGKYTFKVYGNDTSNSWSSTETRTIEINTTIPDTQAPAITFVSPTPENNSVIANNTITVNITSSESLATAILEWNGINQTMLGSGTFWSIEKVNLNNGKYSFRVYGNDSSNNWNVTEARTIEINTIIPDTQAPVITFVSPTPQNNSVLSVNSTLIKITSNENLSSAILEWNGINQTMLGSGTSWSIEKANLNNGKYSFRVYGNDSSNNWNVTETRIIEINTIIPDTQAPVITFISPTPQNNSLLSVNSTLIKIISNENLSSAILEWNGINQTMQGSGTSWSIEKANLNDGKYSLRVYGNDSSNNWNATEARTIEIKVTREEPPKIISHSPVGSSVSLNALINVTFSKPMNHSSAEEAFVLLPQANGVFNWTDNTMTFIPEMLSYNTTYNVTITNAAKDIGGNNLQEAFSWEFNTEIGIINTLPVPHIISPANDSVISNIVEIKAITNDEDVVLTLFEYSSDGLNWFEIGKDYIGTDGWNTTWNVTLIQVGSLALRAKMTDSGGLNGTDTIYVTISMTNHPPVAYEQAADTSKNTSVNINLTASDPDNDPLTFTILSQPANGTLSGAPPNLTYAPYPQFSGTDSFTFKANDSKADSNVAAITITVTSPNNAPSIAPIEDKIMIYSTILQVPIYASDPDSDAITLSASGLPPFASFKDNGNGTGSIVFKPCSGTNAIYPIIVSAGDGSLSDSTKFDLTVKNPNYPPLAENQTVVTFENTQLYINLIASDPDSDPLSISIVNPPVNGILSGTPPHIIYKPNPDYSGTDRLTFEAVDIQNESSAAFVDIIVVSNASIANDNSPPVIESITAYPANTTAGSTINISVKASDNTGVVKVTSNGTIFKNSGGQWLGNITAASVIGKASVTINVTDAAGNTAHRFVDYNVVSRVGGISITSMPKPLSLSQCSSGILNVKLISTANIDDLVNVIINTNGISSASAINLTWFNRTLVPVQVPSGRTVIVPLRMTVPGDAAIGYRMFKDNAKSLGFNATSVDTGVVNVRK